MTKNRNAKKVQYVKKSIGKLKPIKVTFTVNPAWEKQLKRVSSEVEKLSKIPYLNINF